MKPSAMEGPTALVTFLLLLLLPAVAWGLAVPTNQENYWVLRSQMLVEEESRMIGEDLKFQGKERIANQVLMDAKVKEFEIGFHEPSKFLPSRNFMEVVNKIRASPVFQIISEMPKGAILHAHDTAITSSHFVYWNITFRPNLYVCDVNGLLNLKFFDKPTSDCHWQLLSEVRKNDKDGTIDQRIIKQMTMLHEHPDQVYPDVDVAWNKFMSIFETITPMLTYRPIYEDHFYQGLLEFYNDNILYLELRSTFPTLYELDGTEYGPVELARIYKKVTDRFIQDHPDFVGVKLIYAPSRKSDDHQMDEYLATARLLKKELPNFIAGFDIVGQEDKGKPLIDFADKLQSIDDDVRLFFHAGETNWNGLETDENLFDAVLLNTKRIGHGYALLKHPKVMEVARQKDIAIEVAPISNQVLNLVKDLRNHPVSVLFANNYPVVISNDDPGLWGAQGLSYDFYEAFIGIMSRHADIRALKKLAMNSIAYSSMNDKEKNQATEIWRRKWDQFIDQLATKM